MFHQHQFVRLAANSTTTQIILTTIRVTDHPSREDPHRLLSIPMRNQYLMMQKFKHWWRRREVRRGRSPKKRHHHRSPRRHHHREAGGLLLRLLLLLLVRGPGEILPHLLHLLLPPLLALPPHGRRRGLILVIRWARTTEEPLSPQQRRRGGSSSTCPTPPPQIIWMPFFLSIFCAFSILPCWQQQMCLMSDHDVIIMLLSCLVSARFIASAAVLMCVLAAYIITD